MDRNRWLLVLAVVLAVANVAWLVYSRWGLITVDVNDAPLAQVVHSIEKQGGISLKSDLPADTKVTMHVIRVPLTEALETLSAVTEARWRLAYVVAGDKGSILNVLSSITAGQRPEGWKMMFVPFQSQDDQLVPPDPRRDVWTVKDPQEKTAQAYLEQAAQSVAATFLVPNDWNPAVSASLSSGEVRKVVPRLAKLAHGQSQEVFLLTGGRRRGDDTADRGAGEDGGGRWMGLNREAMAARAQAEVDKLPAAQRAAAQAELDERKKFFEGMRDLSPDERRAKMEDFFNRSDIQDRMEQRGLEREARMTPEQRVRRAQRYMENKAKYRGDASGK